MAFRTLTRTYSRALVVDSDAISVKLAVHSLRALGITTIATAQTMQNALSQVALNPDVVIAEVQVAHEPCFTLFETSKQLPSPPLVIAMSATASRSQIFRLPSYGVSFFLEKPLTTSALSRALSANQRDLHVVTELDRGRVFSKPIDDFVQRCRETWKLTSAETEVLRCSCAGMTRQEIAGERGVSLNTVKTHVRAILNKAGTTSMRHVVRQLEFFHASHHPKHRATPLYHRGASA